MTAGGLDARIVGVDADPLLLGPADATLGSDRWTTAPHRVIREPLRALT
ncbi:hypothetical protein [Nocardia miyunensis]|nr:hypothetical protein [Nocardia miyunensis]